MIDTAPQHGPRPLPLFLDLLRSETAASPDLRAAALAGLARYQRASRDGTPPPVPVAAAAGRARLLDYGGTGPPLVMVPSLINPPDVLDLTPSNSLMRWLATRGVRPLLVDWGMPDAAEAGLDIAGHVETLLLPLLAAVGEPADLAGYCLGGTIAMAAAHLAPARSLTLIAAPWHFSGYPERAQAGVAKLWDDARGTCEALGLVPMELLQAGFWRLDPAALVAKYAAFADLPEDGDTARGFVALEDWANAGAPLTLAAGRDLFETMFRDDAPGRGAWRVGGRLITPATLPCPGREFVSATDRIVPATSAAGLRESHRIGAGHVGMIVGRKGRTTLWERLVE